jgi:hypothetical protein
MGVVGIPRPCRCQSAPPCVACESKLQLWFLDRGVCAGKNSGPIIDRLNFEISKALQVPAVQEKLEKIGVQLMPMSIERFNAFVSKSSQQTGHSPRRQELLASDLANAKENLRNAARDLGCRRLTVHRLS